MRMYDIIQKKKYGGELSDEEIKFFVKGVTDGSIPDYQISPFLMAVYFQGMTDRETFSLTQCMAESGETVDLSNIDGFCVDKHSTGGVGDKTTLVVAPVVAALGGKIAKMTGRGLGHTGGTVDKLESIEGFKTVLSRDDFVKQVNEIGLSVIGQSGNLAPADKKLYALRDVTATIDSIPLIASSIMSKKLAAGAQGIMLDVKTGSGAFMKTVEESEALAEQMVKIGKSAGRKMAAVITDMDKPLGSAVGNSLEVIEAVETLNGNGSEDFTEVCTELATNMLMLVTDESREICIERVRTALSDGSALNKLKEMVKAQGGNPEWIDNTELFPKAEIEYEVKSEKTGYLILNNAEKIGTASVLLGAGREKKEDTVDMSAGIILKKKTGEAVQTGDTIAVFYTNDENKIPEAEKMFRSAVEYSDAPIEKHPLIYKVIR